MPEPADPFNDWADRFATVFAMSGERRTTAAGWANVLARAGYAAHELEEATDWLAAHEAPKSPRELLGALQARLGTQRARVPRRPEDRRGTCALCGGCGMLSVPGEGFLTPRGNPIGPRTMAVLCRCPLGAYFGRQFGDSPPMTLDAYEAARPNWRREEKAHRELRGLEDGPGDLAGPVGRLLERVRRRREPGEEG